MASFPRKLTIKLEERTRQNSLRELPSSNNLIDFFSNDYIGFAKNTGIFQAASKILKEKNIIQNGATGSRLISGNYGLYIELEKYTSEFHNTQTALAFNSGYDANVGFFSAVPQRNDIIFYDEFIHASIRDGIAMSNAKGYKFKHNSLDDLKKVINRVLTSLDFLNHNLMKDYSQNEIYVVTESVFSMDGDSPDLKAFADFCSNENHHLVVDEAHAIGVFGNKGQGLLYELGLQNQVFAQIVTYGKAMGCHGAAILGSQQLKDFLVNFARSFIYTTGLPPHAIATILAAYTKLSNKNETIDSFVHRLDLLENIGYFKSQLVALQLTSFFIPSNSAIHCCVISGNEKVKVIASEIQKRGFAIKAIVAPTVPKGQERLRFCLHSYNKKEEIKEVLTILKGLIS
tara:strand:- start:1544 stop:2746 length:1203 start_codon:yes stop_codon:yes gene_type:complete